MNETSNKNNSPAGSRYATPFNVDLSNLEFKKNFTEYFKRVSSLSGPIKDLMANPSTADFIEENLGPSFGLTPEQKTEITRIIRDVLLGDLFIGEMTQEISSRTRLAPDEAKKNVNLIISELFQPAIEDIKKLQAQKFPEKINKPAVSEKPDLKIEPDINRNNIVDLRNK